MIIHTKKLEFDGHIQCIAIYASFELYVLFSKALQFDNKKNSNGLKSTVDKEHSEKQRKTKGYGFRRLGDWK